MCCIWGCDNSADFLEEVNDSPEISIIDLNDTSNHHTFWVDSAKLSTGDGLFPYRFQLSLTDYNSNIRLVDIRENIDASKDSLNGVLLFQYDTILIDVEVDEVNSDNQKVDIELFAFDESLITLSFIIFDDFSRSDTAILQLSVFDNLSPVVDYEIKDEGIGELIRKIDLSNSFDRDEKYGGRIVSYHWIIEEIEFTLTQDFIEFPFPDRGSYSVLIFVTDNNFSQSAFKTIEVSVQ